MRAIHALVATSLAAAAALAQQTHVVPVGLGSGAGNSSNSFPWGTTAAGFPGLRVMTCYDSANFTQASISTPIRIMGLRWHANDSVTSWTGGRFAQATVALATAAVDYGSITTNFAQNVSSDRAVVYSGPVDYLAGSGAGIGHAGPVVVDLTLTVPFVYDPARGDLIIDVDYPGGANYSGGTMAAMDVHTGSALASRAYASTTYPAGTGTTLNHGAVVELVYAPAAGLFAAFRADHTGGASPLSVQFTDTSYSSDPAGVTGWAWDFDGDGTIDSTQRNPQFTFTNCGRYSVRLTVTDPSHPPDSLVKPDCIVTDAIEPDFTYEILAPRVVMFTDTSTPDATSEDWDLDGDGVVDASGRSVVWTYPSSAATTPVRLTVQRLCGAPRSITKTVLPAPALLTTLAGGNGLSGSGAGNVFDLEVTNPAGITVTGLTVCPFSPTTPLGAPIGCEIWITDAAGGFAANHANPEVWRRCATGTATFAGGTATTTVVPTAMTLDRRFHVPSGRYSLAIHMVGCGITYTSGTGIPEFANADLRILCGLGKASPFGASANSPRIWNGILYYDLCSLGSLSGYGFFAHGCPNSAGTVSQQSMNGQPAIGQTLTIDFDALPLDLAIAVLGLSRTTSGLGPLPLDLLPLGAPGCQLHVSPDRLTALFGAGGHASYALPIPNDPALLCLPFHVQSIALDPAANAFGWVATDAGAGVVGN